MCLSGQNVLHSEAVQWYYDIVVGRAPGVPEAMIRHIRRCWVCRKRILRLKEAVTGAGGETDGSRSEMKRDVIDTLSLHFGCLDEQVTCSRIKPFLPGLLMPSVQIRIPTPITVHIDHCPECAEDLEVLGDLGLSAEQLERLQRLYEHQAQGDPRLCRRAKSEIAAFVRGSLDEIDGEILNHLCTCPRCRLRVFRGRHKLLESGLTGGTGAAITCGGDIPMARLFDYAVPYGRTTDGQEPAGESHVRACRACLTRIQVLDETIYGIAERTNSGVATVYSTLEPGAQRRCGEAKPAPRIAAQACEAEETAGPFAEPYPEYPIHVQVIHGEPEQVAASALRLGSGRAWSPAKVGAALRQTMCNPEVRFLLKTAVAVAAVVVLAVLFRSTASSTSGVTLAQVFKAFGRAENVHISRFYPATGQLTQDFWISRTMDVVLTTAGQRSILCDLRGRKEYAHQASDGTVETTELTDRAYANTRRLMATCLGLTAQEVPSNATWIRVDNNGAVGLETYELIYSEQSSSGVTALQKLRVTIDSGTRLPREVLRFREVPTQNRWDHIEATKVQYPDENAIGAALDEHHFRRGSEAY